MKWKVLPKKSDDLKEQLLFNRGIKTVKQKKQFFDPILADFEQDFKIPGSIKALARIKQAIKNEELIIAYGDFDVDGICGAAILYLGLTKMGAKVVLLADKSAVIYSENGFDHKIMEKFIQARAELCGYPEKVKKLK